MNDVSIHLQSRWTSKYYFHDKIIILLISNLIMVTSASGLTPSTKSSPDNGYTVSSSFFSKITETFRPTTQKENSVPENIKPSRSDNQEEEPQLEYDDDHEMFATPTPELERRDGAKKAMKYNALLSMAKLKKKYKMKKMKLKYKLARDKMKYK